jgi:DnaJ-domain-containing protein 1
VLVILTWIAHSDGDFDDSERQFIYTCGEQNQVNRFTSEIISICASSDVKSLLYALKFLGDVLSIEGKKQFLKICCSIAVADGKVAFAENHYLRLISDLFGFSTIGLNSLFMEVTGREFPLPQRLHAADWWEKLKEKRKGSKSTSGKFKQDSDGMNWSKALGILGLDEEPTEEELKKVYRNLVKANHPDRFQKAGKEAMAAATERIKDINRAYDYLNK